MIAITFVTGFHLWRFMGSEKLSVGPFNIDHIVAGGAIGVDIFFVVSGYAMMLTWEKHKSYPDRVKKFFFARFWRIYPPYLVAVLFWVAMAFTLVPRPLPLGDILAHLTFTHTLFRQYFFGVSGVLWSLAVEAHFYLLFPLIISMPLRYRFGMALAGLAYAYISTFFFPPLFPLRWNVFAYLPAFLLGMALFSIRQSGFRLSTPIATLFIIGALVSMTRMPVFGISVFPRLLLASAFAIPLLLWDVKLPKLLSYPIGKIGLASYSIYLYNYVFQVTPMPVVRGAAGWAMYAALIFFVGFVMWFLVETNVPKLRAAISHLDLSKRRPHRQKRLH